MAELTPVTDASFRADVLNSTTLVLVDFWAVWCGSCRAIAPHLQALARDMTGKLRVFQLNIDENLLTPLSYQIRSPTTLLLFKGGQVIDQMSGNPGSASKLVAFVERHLA